MKNFIKISASFLASALLCLPLSAADGARAVENGGDQSRYAALLFNAAIQNEDELPHVANHQYQELGSMGVFDDQHDSRSSSGDHLASESSSGLNTEILPEIQNISYEETGEVLTITLSNGEHLEVKPTEQGFESLKKLVEQKENKNKDNADTIGEVVKACVQCFPGGVPLTTLTSAAARRLYGRDTFTAALIGYFTRRTESDVLAGLTKVESASLNGHFHILNCMLADANDANIGLLSFDGEYAEVLNRGASYNSDDYLEGGSRENDTLWAISEAPHSEGGVIIKNTHNRRLLTWVSYIFNNPYSGYYAVLANPKDRGALDGQYRTDAVWDVYQDQEGKYILKNRGTAPGLLCYADKKSANGQYAEVLSRYIGSGVSSYHEAEYVAGGVHRNTIRWELSKIVEETPLENSFLRDGNEWTLMDEASGNDPVEEVNSDYSLMDISVKVEDGVYTVRNGALSSIQDAYQGLLSSSQERSRSGFYAEVLGSAGKSYSPNNYLPGGALGEAIKWRICGVQYQGNEYCTIRSCTYGDGGFLTWVNKNTYSGYYVQALVDNGQSSFFGNNCYPSERDKYKEGGEYWEHVLWSLFKVPNTDYYVLRNLGRSKVGEDLNVGCLTYTESASCNGQYAQVLHSDGRYYNQDKEKYKSGGAFERSIWWELSLTDLGGVD